MLRRYGTSAGAQLRQTLCYFNNNNPIVCCPDDLGKLPNENIGKSSESESEPNQNDPSNNNVGSSYGPLFPPQCGFSDAHHSRVVGGIPAELGMVLHFIIYL